MTTRLLSLTVEAFRGFADRQTLPLDAQVVLLTGGNGVGKTSVVDAIVWNLTGQLGHLDRARRRRNEETLVNRYRADASAFVQLEFESNGRLCTAIRIGNSRASTLQLTIGGERWTGSRATSTLADVFQMPSPEGLGSAIERWGVLRQEELRAVLNVDPDEVHARLRDLLGLGHLDSFEAAVHAAVDKRKAALTEAEQRLGKAREEAADARAKLSRPPPPAVTVSEAATALERAIVDWSPTIEVARPIEATPSALRAMLANLRTAYEFMRDQVSDLSAVEKRTESLDPAAPAVAELERQRDRAAALADDATNQSIATEKRLSDLQASADAYSRLAAAAEPLLAPTCPVCGQDIDPAEVRERLHQHSGAVVRELSALLAESAEVQKRRANLTIELRHLEAALTDRRVAETVRVQLIGERARILEGVGALQEEGRAVKIRPPSADTSGMRLVLDGLTKLGQAAREYLGVVEALAPKDVGVDAAVRDAEDRIAALAPEVERLRGGHRRLDDLLKAIQEEGVEVTADELSTLNPLFGEVYRRMSPHPTFTELALEHDLYYRRGRTMPMLSDPLLEIDVNPQLICSVGQLNVVALSYFIALTLMAGESALPFMLLDDPLQSLDDVNVLGFADLSRHLRASHQLIITTHDTRFAELLARKLTPRQGDTSTLVIDFVGWTRGGPVTDDRRLHQEPAPRLLAAG